MSINAREAFFSSSTKNPVIIFTSPAICAIIQWDTAVPAGFTYVGKDSI